MRKVFFSRVIVWFAINIASLGFAGPNVGDPAPNFTLPDTALVNHSLSDFTGRVVVLNFWQAFCPTCRAELPVLDVIQKDYSVEQVRIITINIGTADSWSVVKGYARDNSCLFLKDASTSVWSDYYQDGYIPLNYVLETDSEHTVHAWRTGFNETQMRNWINECLPGVEENSQLSTVNCQLKLQVYPNPFTQETHIVFSISHLANDKILNAKCCIYDLSGKLIRTFNHLTNQPFNQVIWDGKDITGVEVPNGVYFLRLSNGKVNLTEKITVMR